MARERKKPPITAAISLLLTAICGTVLLQAAAPPARSGAANASTSPATRPAPEALDAGTLLKDFPRSANASAYNGHVVSIEGRVRDVRTVTTPSGAKETHLALANRLPYSNSPAYILCRVEPSAAAVAAELKRDMVVRVTGTFAGVTVAAERIDMSSCRSIEILPTVGSTDFLVGRWEAFVTMNAQDELVFLREHGRGQILAMGMPMTSIIAYPVFNADGSFELNLSDALGPLTKSTGRWSSVAKPNEPARVRILLPGCEPVECEPVVGKKLALSLPGLAELKMEPKVEAVRLYGTEVEPDAKRMRDETLKWMQTNIAVKGSPKLVEDITRFIERTLDDEGMYTITVGSGLTRGKKLTVLVAGYDKVFTLEYTAAQMNRPHLADMSLQTAAMKRAAKPMKPEVQIESLTLFTQNGWDTTKPLAGKVRLRAIGQPIEAVYGLKIMFNRGFTTAEFPKGGNIPGPEAETFDFKINPLDGVGQTAIPIASGPNPMPVIIVVARTAYPPDLAGAQAIDLAVSEPKALLLDMVPLTKQPEAQ